MQTQPIFNSHNSQTAPVVTARRVAYFVSGLFVFACILMDAVVAVQLQDGTGLTIATYLGLTFGQLALVAIWCSETISAWRSRGLLALLFAAGLAHGWSDATYATWNQWLVVLICYVVVVGVVWRMAGFFFPEQSACSSVQSGNGAGSVALARSRRHRWSLGGMLSVMTLIGLVLGPGRWFTLSYSQTRMVGGHLAVLSTVAATMVWALRSRRPLVQRVGTVSGISMGGGLIMAWFDPALGAWHYSFACLCEAAMISIGYDLFYRPSKVLAFNVDASQGKHDD